ncbi:MAG: hypothetical protein P4L87_03010 [Formivibrio sp.]|nr:hypothetical protein [Formivibrio sp.]
MNEWVLVLMFHLLGAQDEIQTFSPQIISGFTTRQNCENAALTISKRLTILTERSREQQETPGTVKDSVPGIKYECIKIRK